MKTAALLPLLTAFTVLGSTPEQRPPVIMIAGQSREEFSDYVENVTAQGTKAPLPGGAAFYTNLNLDGITTPHRNAPGDNRQDLQFLKDYLDPVVFQIGLWLSPQELHEIAAGDLEAQVHALYEALSALQRPVLLRIGYEFDGPHNRYEPAAYVSAYRVIAKAMRQSPDILLVWHSFAMLPTHNELPVEAWYPGDEWVDWIGISYFQVGTVGYHRAPNRERLIDIARQKRKPVLIGEASAIRYDPSHKHLTGQAYWDYWYQPYFQFIETHPEIRAASIIHVNWDSQNQHSTLGWGDCRIDSDPVILQHWRAKMNEKTWLPRTSDLYQHVRAIK